MLRKIKQKGIIWFLKRVALEFRSPYYPASKKIVSFIRKFNFFSRHVTRVLPISKNDTLYIFYDLNVEPHTFDFAYFLVDAEIFAKKKNIKKLFLWIIPKAIESQADDDDYTKAVGHHSFSWRINNMLLPISGLHSLYSGYGVLPKGASINSYVKEGLVYPENFTDTYRPRLAEFIERRDTYQSNLFLGFSAPPQGKKYISEWVNSLDTDLRIISITLRQYGFDSSRNSNIQEWLKFADWLKERNYQPVFVPDTESCWNLDGKLAQHIIFKEPCWNLGLRMAFYEECALNYFYSNGCAAIAVLNKNVASIVMMPVIKESKNATETMNTMHDPAYDSRRLAFAQQNQWWSKDIDTFENLKNDFLAYEKLYLLK